MDRITDFWIRNRTFIVSILAFLLFMNLCGRIMFPPAHQKVIIREVEPTVSELEDDIRIRSNDRLLNERSVQQTQRNRSIISLMFWLTALTLTGYYLYRKGWLAKLMPQWIAFKGVLFFQKKENRLLYKIVISNNTRESRTFSEPTVGFKRWFKLRKFKIKDPLFPLTLMPGTSHALTINIDQFYQKLSDLKGFNRINASVLCDNKKVYRTKTYYKWFIKKG